MALIEVRVHPDPILRRRARPVTDFNEKLHRLLDDMYAVVNEKDGIGLAAPQVGTLRRAMVVDHTGRDRLELINPEILEVRGLVVCQEGCLSLPDTSAYVRRPHYVRMKYQDRHGNHHLIESKGIQAIALCHELDHLNGVLFTDRAIEPTEEEKRRLKKAKDDVAQAQGTKENPEPNAELSDYLPQD